MAFVANSGKGSEWTRPRDRSDDGGLGQALGYLAVTVHEVAAKVLPARSLIPLPSFTV